MPQHTQIQVRVEGSFTETFPMGAMGESSRKVQIASTYITGIILIYVAVGHSNNSSADVKTSSL